MFRRAERLWPEDIPFQRLILMTSLIYTPPPRRLRPPSIACRPRPILWRADHAAAWRRYEAVRAGYAGKAEAARILAAVAPTANRPGIHLDSIIKLPYPLWAIGTRRLSHPEPGPRKRRPRSADRRPVPAREPLRSERTRGSRRSSEQSRPMTQYWIRDRQAPRTSAPLTGAASLPAAWCGSHYSSCVRNKGQKQSLLSGSLMKCNAILRAPARPRGAISNWRVGDFTTGGLQ